jgi:hypothetical protein
VLEVLGGYFVGNAYYDVYDQGTFLFTTSVGDASGAYQTDPIRAKRNSDFGRGQLKLAKGFHSIGIRTSWVNPNQYKDGGAGWFRISTVHCECLKQGEWCTLGGANKCCRGLICRLKAGDDANGPKQYLRCVTRSGRYY